MKATFEELRNGKISGIPDSPGIYWVKIPNNFNLEIMQNPDGIDMNPKYLIENLQMKIKHYLLEEKGGGILYIGKANNLRERIESYTAFGYNDKRFIKHAGGRAIWYIKNNKQLLVEYIEYKNLIGLEKDIVKQYLEKEETEFIDKYIIKYGVLPFGNQIRGKKKYRIF